MYSNKEKAQWRERQKAYKQVKANAKLVKNKIRILYGVSGAGVMNEWETTFINNMYDSLDNTYSKKYNCPYSPKQIAKISQMWKIYTKGEFYEPDNYLQSKRSYEIISC